MSFKFAASAFSLFSLASGLLPHPLLAATATASFGVTATVQAGCRISATSIPSQNHLATLAMAKRGVSVTCTMATPYVVDLRTGNWLDAAPIGRLTGPVSDWRGSVVAGYPSLLNFDPVNGSSFGTPMKYHRIPSVQLIAARASAHAITVVVTY